MSSTAPDDVALRNRVHQLAHQKRMQKLKDKVKRARAAERPEVEQTQADEPKGA